MNESEKAEDEVKTAETDRFFQKAEGDRIMTNYQPELNERNYDSAMKILEKANGCFELAHDPALPEPFFAPPPRSVVAKVATRDGDAAKRKVRCLL